VGAADAADEDSGRAVYAGCWWDADAKEELMDDEAEAAL
jgi:hypothetical protein